MKVLSKLEGAVGRIIFSTWYLQNIIGGEEPRFFLEKIISLELSPLKLTFHLDTRASIFNKSRLRLRQGLYFNVYPDSSHNINSIS